MSMKLAGRGDWIRSRVHRKEVFCIKRNNVTVVAEVWGRGRVGQKGDNVRACGRKTTQKLCDSIAEIIRTGD